MVDFRAFPPRPGAPDVSVDTEDGPRMAKALPVALAVFYDGSYVIATYELLSWYDEASPDDERAMMNTAMEHLPTWQDQCGSRDDAVLVLGVTMPDGLTKRTITIERYSSTHGLERLH